MTFSTHLDHNLLLGRPVNDTLDLTKISSSPIDLPERMAVFTLVSQRMKIICPDLEFFDHVLAIALPVAQSAHSVEDLDNFIRSVAEFFAGIADILTLRMLGAITQGSLFDLKLPEPAKAATRDSTLEASLGRQKVIVRIYGESIFVSFPGIIDDKGRVRQYSIPSDLWE